MSWPDIPKTKAQYDGKCDYCGEGFSALDTIAKPPGETWLHSHCAKEYTSKQEEERDVEWDVCRYCHLVHNGECW